MKNPTIVRQHVKNVEFIEQKLTERFGFRINPTRVMDRHMSHQKRGENKKELFVSYVENGWTGLKDSYGSGTNEIPYGHNKVRELLQMLPHDGKPGIVIWKNCYHTINGMSHYIRKRPRTESELLKPANSGKIIEKYKDFPDVVRYLACVNYYRKKIDPNKYRRSPKKRGLI
jgi:hypothetical protein